MTGVSCVFFANWSVFQSIGNWIKYLLFPAVAVTIWLWLYLVVPIGSTSTSTWVMCFLFQLNQLIGHRICCDLLACSLAQIYWSGLLCWKVPEIASKIGVIYRQCTLCSCFTYLTWEDEEVKESPSFRPFYLFALLFTFTFDQSSANVVVQGAAEYSLFTGQSLRVDNKLYKSNGYALRFAQAAEDNCLPQVELMFVCRTNPLADWCTQLNFMFLHWVFLYLSMVLDGAENWD